jgi:UDP-N-acetylglucosamine 2-epimerase (non-hydrolysing)
MMKVMTIIGTRPDIVKLALTIQELDKYTNHIFVHTGQNYDYELNQVFFDDLDLRKPDYFLGVAADTVAEAIGNIIIKVDEVLEKEKPDAVLFYGDTNTTLAVIAVKRRRIPIFHMEAGNRCFDMRVPEEINRKIIDHTSDINMTLTEHARRYLIAEGIKPQTIIKTGSSIKELVTKYSQQINSSKILDELSLQEKEYFLVSAHREENIDSQTNFDLLIQTLNKIAEKYNKPVIVSTHPRTLKKIDTLGSNALNKLVILHKPFGYFDYLHLQQKTYCVVSDSGTITEESSILSFPAITIRDAHERPEGMDEGTLIMCGLNPEKVLDAIDVTVAQFKELEKPFKIVNDYDVDNVSKKVVKIILSYTDYINRETWKKF